MSYSWKRPRVPHLFAKQKGGTKKVAQTEFQVKKVLSHVVIPIQLLPPKHSKTANVRAPEIGGHPRNPAHSSTRHAGDTGPVELVALLPAYFIRLVAGLPSHRRGEAGNIGIPRRTLGPKKEIMRLLVAHCCTLQRPCLRNPLIPNMLVWNTTCIVEMGACTPGPTGEE